jgi:hypothetical protein
MRHIDTIHEAGFARSMLPRRSTPLVTQQSMLGSRWSAMLGQELSERLIDGGGVTKDGGHVRFEQDHIRAFLVRLVVLATNATAELHLRNVVFFGSASLLTHTIFVHSVLRCTRNVHFK